MEQFIDKLKEIERTYGELEEKLSQPEIISDQQTYRRLAKTRHSLEQTVTAYHNWQKVNEEISSTQEVLRTASDKELRELAEEELDMLQKKDEELQAKLRLLLLPKDPNDDRDIMVEIRAGTGGDEASL